jgi:hypothetical protein
VTRPGLGEWDSLAGLSELEAQRRYIDRHAVPAVVLAQYLSLRLQMTRMILSRAAKFRVPLNCKCGEPEPASRTRTRNLKGLGSALRRVTIIVRSLHPSHGKGRCRWAGARSV